MKYGPYASWISRAKLDLPLSTNQGSDALAFQRWFKFKEAFSPELVRLAFSKLGTWPQTCLDPFGGCGTTALTSQFLGVEPTIAEINPFLADLAAAKLERYDLRKVRDDYLRVFNLVDTYDCTPEQALAAAPATLMPRRGSKQWVFPREVMKRILAFRSAIASLSLAKHRRLFRVLLGSILVDVSNVTVNGKGRKYRGDWQFRQKRPEDVDARFDAACTRAIADITRFGNRPAKAFRVRRADARSKIRGISPVDVVFCSPPYPNSFDYTDIYNLELWVLGYLRTRADEKQLRQTTLHSHVQVYRDYPPCVLRTPLLDHTVSALNKRKKDLWNPWIPSMVESYFDDLMRVLEQLRKLLTASGSVFFVIGDSSYADVTVRSADIFTELASKANWHVNEVSPLRGLRKSAQQGGEIVLEEHLVHLTLRA